MSCGRSRSLSKRGLPFTRGLPSIHDCTTPGQYEALRRPRSTLENFTFEQGLQPVPFKQQDWEKKLQRKRLAYDGSAGSKAEMLTWAQVEPALPKVGQAAQLDSCAQSECHMKEIRADPGQVLLQRSKWPARVKQARAMIHNNEEWDKLCTGVWSSGVIQPMDDSEVIRDQHAIPLAGGLFGICKGKFIQDAPAQRLQEVLGLICNIPPRNAVQIKVEGDVEGLPYEGNWQCGQRINPPLALGRHGWLFLAFPPAKGAGHALHDQQIGQGKHRWTGRGPRADLANGDALGVDLGGRHRSVSPQPASKVV